MKVVDAIAAILTAEDVPFLSAYPTTRSSMPGRPPGSGPCCVVRSASAWESPTASRAS
jgi:hypothetical protein